MKTEHIHPHGDPLPWYLFPFVVLCFLISLIAIYLLLIPYSFLRDQVRFFIPRQVRQVVREMGPFPLDMSVNPDGTLTQTPNRHVPESDTVLSSVSDRMTEAICTLEEISVLAASSVFGSFVQYLRIITQDVQEMLRPYWKQSMVLLGLVLVSGLVMLPGIISPEQVPIFLFVEKILLLCAFSTTIWHIETNETLRPDRAILFELMVGQKDPSDKTRAYEKRITETNRIFLVILVGCVAIASILLVVGSILSAVDITQYPLLLFFKMITAAWAGAFFSYIEACSRPRI